MANPYDTLYSKSLELYITKVEPLIGNITDLDNMNNTQDLADFLNSDPGKRRKII